MQKLDEQGWKELYEKYHGFHDSFLLELRLSYDRKNGSGTADIYLDAVGRSGCGSEPVYFHFRLLKVESFRFGYGPNEDFVVLSGIDAWWQDDRVILNLDGDSSTPPTQKEIETESHIITCGEILFEGYILEDPEEPGR